MRFEALHHSHEVGQRARQPIQFICHDTIHQACLDVTQQALQRRPLQRAAGEAAIVVAIAHQHPALGALTGHVGLTGIALRIQRVELLLQPLVGGFARIDRAAKLLRGGRHGRLDAGAPGHAPALPFSPKNVQPFQRVPVMWRATAESDW